MKKDLKSARTEPLFTLVSVILPLNVLLLMSLLVVSGGRAPTAVVMQDAGPLAQQVRIRSGVRGNIVSTRRAGISSSVPTRASHHHMRLRARA